MPLFSDEFVLGQSRRAIIAAIDERLLNLSAAGDSGPDAAIGAAVSPQVAELVATRSYLTRSQLAFLRDGIMVAATGLLINEGLRLLGIISEPPVFADATRAFGVVVAGIVVGWGSAFVPYWDAHNRCVAIAKALNARSDLAAS